MIRNKGIALLDIIFCVLLIYVTVVENQSHMTVGMMITVDGRLFVVQSAIINLLSLHIAIVSKPQREKPQQNPPALQIMSSQMEFLQIFRMCLHSPIIKPDFYI